MINKSNQFNLTGRRHTQSELKNICANGGDVWAVSYSDNFGSQGIISVLVLCPQDDGLEIDTWVMSCRVLNRTVEEGVFSWLCGVYEGVKLFGIYTPAKNALVKTI